VPVRLRFAYAFVIAVMLLAASRAPASTPLQEKGAAALRQAHDEPNGSTFEHGGMILENQGTLRFMEPHPENSSPDSVQAYDKSQLLSGDRMVGTYHTHPCMVGYYHAYFSIPDVIVAIFTDVPMFMLDECTGEVHEYFARVDTVHGSGDDVETRGPHCEKRFRHLPTGRIVGNIGERDPPHVNRNEMECAP
jgi:hypothetical protein